MIRYFDRIMIGTIGVETRIKPDAAPYDPTWGGYDVEDHVMIRRRAFLLTFYSWRTTEDHGGRVDQGISVSDPGGYIPRTSYGMKSISTPARVIYINRRYNKETRAP